MAAIHSQSIYWYESIKPNQLKVRMKALQVMFIHYTTLDANDTESKSRCKCCIILWSSPCIILLFCISSSSSTITTTIIITHAPIHHDCLLLCTLFNECNVCFILGYDVPSHGVALLALVCLHFLFCAQCEDNNPNTVLPFLVWVVETW